MVPETGRVGCMEEATVKRRIIFFREGREKPFDRPPRNPETTEGTRVRVRNFIFGSDPLHGPGRN